MAVWDGVPVNIVRKARNIVRKVRDIVQKVIGRRRQAPGRTCPAPGGTYLHAVIELRQRYDAGELTEEQFRDELRKLRPLRDAG